MQITDVRVRKANTESPKLLGFASVTFDDEFVVHDIKVLQGNDNDLFVAMPSKRMPDGQFKDIAHPINAECRAKIQEAVAEAFKNLD